MKRLLSRIKKLHLLADTAKNSADRLEAYSELASNYRTLESPEDELEWLTKAYRVLKRQRHASVARFDALIRLYELNRLAGENSQKARLNGLTFVEGALMDAHQMGDLPRLSSATLSKAFLLITLDTADSENLNRASIILEDLLFLNKEMGFQPEFRHLIFANQAIIAGKLQKPEEAVRLLEQALEVFPSGELPERKASILKSLAKYYYYFGKNPTQARALLEQALGLGSYLHAEQLILKDLETICAELGDHSAAYGYLQQRMEQERKWNLQRAEMRMVAMQVKTELLDAKRKREIFELENIKLVDANNRIAEQRNVLAEKNKHISDSIAYARRLQEAILPASAFLRSILPDHFMLFMPKDVVAGDFFWAMSSEDYSYMAIADCTGHGVPGAMVSMICHNALTQSVQLGAQTTNEILDTARTLVKDAFGNSGVDVMDGMDITLIRLDKHFRKLQYSGAHNPLWIFRGEEHIVFKGDRQPVGNWVMEKPFSCQETDLIPGDMLYLFSDGFADQFGGPEIKKIRTKGLTELLLAVSPLPSDEQHVAVKNYFLDWMGNNEQMDDVSLMGIRVPSI